MEEVFWFEQQQSKPLFPDLLWSRPENKLHAGKLLIIGGNSSGFRAAANAFAFANKAGIGSSRILLPDSLRKTVGDVFLEIGEYAPSTPSGSFSYRAFAELLMHSNWADGVLLAGDFGRNSETAQLLEYYANKYPGQLTVTGDALDYFLDNPAVLKRRKDTLIVATPTQLQKIGISSKVTKPFTSELSLQNFAEALHNLEHQGEASFITVHNDHVFVASSSKVSSTPIAKNELELAATASVWWLQTPGNTYSALTTSMISL